MSSELVLPLLISHLMEQTAIQNLLGRTPVKIFPGSVPAKVQGIPINVPFVALERGPWDEVNHFSAGTGELICPTRVVVVADTITQAGEVYSALRTQLHMKWSETWSERLAITESQMDLGNQVPLLEADGSPSAWQQLVGELFLICSVLPVSE